MAPDGVVESAAVVLGVAVVVVVASAAGVTVFDGGPAGGGPTFDADTDANTTGPPSEYRPESVILQPIPARGSVQVDQSYHADGNTTDRKVVLIDQASRVRQEEVRPLFLALTAAGHEVRYVSGNLNESLQSADAYVRIDPGQSLSRGEIAGVRNFTENGGRVLLVAEPNRIEVSVSLFTTSLTIVRTAMVELAAEYGIVFGNRYLYDTTTNDGNFKNVLARPTNASTAPDLGRVAFYTATRIDSRNGTVLLRTPPTTRLSDDGAARRYPIAVRTGNVLALGDGTFLHEGRHNVADNEAFVGYVVEFLVSGDRGQSADSEPEPEPEPETADGTETATPTATPAPASTLTPEPAARSGTQ